jgi:hypothetical protein
MENDCGKCPHSATIASLRERDAEFVKTLERFEEKLDKIADSVSKIVVLESAHMTQKEALNRAFGEIDSLKKQVSDLVAALNERNGAAKMLKFIWPVIYVLGGGIGTLAIMQLRYLLWSVGVATGVSH